MDMAELRTSEGIRLQILALLELEPQTDAITRKIAFLERDLARLEIPQGKYQYIIK